MDSWRSKNHKANLPLVGGAAMRFLRSSFSMPTLEESGNPLLISSETTALPRLSASELNGERSLCRNRGLENTFGSYEYVQALLDKEKDWVRNNFYGQMVICCQALGVDATEIERYRDALLDRITTLLNNTDLCHSLAGPDQSYANHLGRKIDIMYERIKEKADQLQQENPQASQEQLDNSLREFIRDTLVHEVIHDLQASGGSLGIASPHKTGTTPSTQVGNGTQEAGSTESPEAPVIMQADSSLATNLMDRTFIEGSAELLSNAILNSAGVTNGKITYPSFMILLSDMLFNDSDPKSKEELMNEFLQYNLLGFTLTREEADQLIKDIKESIKCARSSLPDGSRLEAAAALIGCDLTTGQSSAPLLGQEALELLCPATYSAPGDIEGSLDKLRAALLSQHEKVCEERAASEARLREIGGLGGLGTDDSNALMIKVNPEKSNQPES